jgi:hypothetical protein
LSNVLWESAVAVERNQGCRVGQKQVKSKMTQWRGSEAMAKASRRSWGPNLAMMVREVRIKEKKDGESGRG